MIVYIEKKFSEFLQLKNLTIKKTHDELQKLQLDDPILKKLCKLIRKDFRASSALFSKNTRSQTKTEDSFEIDGTACIKNFDVEISIIFFFFSARDPLLTLMLATNPRQ